MKKIKITEFVNRKFNMTVLKAKKYSPEILIVVGAVGTVAAAVTACRATLKVHDIAENAKKDIDKIHEVSSNEEFSEEYSEDDRKKDITIVYMKTGLAYVKLYAPAVIIGSVSILCMVTSHNILKKRNVALAAAYATIDKGYKEYRSRVIERFGEEVDHELLHDIKAKKFENENGKAEEKKVVSVNNNGYSKVFDSKNRYWNKSMDQNLYFLKMEQHLANDQLRARGYLFLNEIYERLGFPISKEGQMIGWVYDPKDVYSIDFVDFGIRNNGCVHKETKNGEYEPVITLDFNVQGNILDMI